MIKSGSEGLVVQRIVDWIQEQVQKAGASGVVFGCSGGADSALVGIFCKKAFPAYSLAVFMPCQSSQVSLARAGELCNQFDIEYMVVDLEHPFTQIREQFESQRKLHNLHTVHGNAHLITDKSPSFMAQASLKSCLRTPVLDYVAKMRNAVIVGTGNRDEDGLLRYFNKRGDGCVDISPIAQLHKSEVYQLLRFLGAPVSIITATPTADLWGPDGGQTDEGELGMTYAEVEWADEWARDTNLFASWHDGFRMDSVNLNDLAEMTPRQFEVLKKVRNMELKTRHKEGPPPVCELERQEYGSEFE